MKRLFIIICSVCVLLTSAIEVIYANSCKIELPADGKATIAGFTEKRAIISKYDLDKKLDGETIDKSQVVGYCYVYLGKYRAKDKVDGKYYDAVIIKCAMEPRCFQSKTGRKFYGFSEKLNLQMFLEDYETYEGNSPTNDTTGSTSYSFGINGGYKAASLSGSVNLKSEYCTVKDTSSISQNKFEITYDYKTSIWDCNSNSEQNVMLFEQTWQYATCEWSTSHANHTKYVKVNVDFGVAQNKHAGFTSAFTYVVNGLEGYNLRYSNTMEELE